MNRQRVLIRKRQGQAFRCLTIHTAPQYFLVCLSIVLRADRIARKLDTGSTEQRTRLGRGVGTEENIEA